MAATTEDRLVGLVKAASLVLLKFTEGEEDWTEWVDLRDALEAASSGLVIDDDYVDYVHERAVRRIADFDMRRTRRAKENEDA